MLKASREGALNPLVPAKAGTQDHQRAKKVER
jgi:hypothetical protein